MPETEILIRQDPKGTPNEGAFEDGNRLTVIGRKLVVGEKMPDIFLWQRDIYNRFSSVERARLTPSYLLYSVNGFLTPVCGVEATHCQELVAAKKIPDGISLYGVSNEDRLGLDLNAWGKRNQITHQILSSKDSDAGIKLGLYIPEYGGQLQRALFGVVNKILVYVEYVYDQGGPLPNFETGVRAIEQARIAQSSAMENLNWRKPKF